MYTEEDISNSNFDMQFKLMPHLVKGRNLLELDVTNCWANRLIGDGKLPKEQRKTQSNVGGKFQKPGSEKLLRVSGLLGPVRLQFAEIVSPSVSK